MECSYTCRLQLQFKKTIATKQRVKYYFEPAAVEKKERKKQKNRKKQRTNNMCIFSSQGLMHWQTCLNTSNKMWKGRWVYKHVLISTKTIRMIVNAACLINNYNITKPILILDEQKQAKQCKNDACVFVYRVRKAAVNLSVRKRQDTRKVQANSAFAAPQSGSMLRY